MRATLPSLAQKPVPNGGRVNIGRYGNTAEASLTPTNGALTLISFYDGGRASGTNVPVTWNARGSTTNAMLTISYSADGGLTWTVLTNGIPAIGRLLDLGFDPQRALGPSQAEDRSDGWQRSRKAIANFTVRQLAIRFLHQRRFHRGTTSIAAPSATMPTAD